MGLEKEIHHHHQRTKWSSRQNNTSKLPVLEGVFMGVAWHIWVIRPIWIGLGYVCDLLWCIKGMGAREQEVMGMM